MKKLFGVLASILLFASLGFSQILGVTLTGGAPTGNCTTLNAFYVNTTNNTLYICVSGSYIQFTNSSGGGAVSVANGGTGLTSGTSGGIPYFASSSTMASSAALTSGQFVLGGGAGASPNTSFSVVPVANGGTALASGTSGGVLGFTASGTIASSAALAVNGVVIGGGAGATPTAITAGTADQVLVTPHAGGAPTMGQVDLSQSAAIKSILLAANGGFPVFNPAGTQQTAATLHAVFGTCTLGTNCAVTLTGSAAFTSATSYGCGATDFTGANAIKAVQAAGSVTFTGTGTDVIQFNCIGT